MCLLDTTDGALMSALYNSSSFSQDDIAILYYSIVLTTVTAIVAVIIGTIQLFSLIVNIAEPKGPFWDGVRRVGDMYDIIGGCIVGLFVIAGVTSMLAYKSWRKRIDGGQEDELGLPVEGPEEEGRGLGGDAKSRRPVGEESGKIPISQATRGIEQEGSEVNMDL